MQRDISKANLCMGMDAVMAGACMQAMILTMALTRVDCEALPSSVSS